jgi:hypothetical protein
MRPDEEKGRMRKSLTYVLHLQTVTGQSDQLPLPLTDGAMQRRLRCRQETLPFRLERGLRQVDRVDGSITSGADGRVQKLDVGRY